MILEQAEGAFFNFWTFSDWFYTYRVTWPNGRMHYKSNLQCVSIQTWTQQMLGYMWTLRSTLEPLTPRIFLLSFLYLHFHCIIREIGKIFENFFSKLKSNGIGPKRGHLELGEGTHFTNSLRNNTFDRFHPIAYTAVFAIFFVFWSLWVNFWCQFPAFLLQFDSAKYCERLVNFVVAQVVAFRFHVILKPIMWNSGVFREGRGVRGAAAPPFPWKKY